MLLIEAALRVQGGSLHRSSFVAGLIFPSTVLSSCFASAFSSTWLNRDISWSRQKLPFPGKSAKIEAATSDSRVDLCRECRWSRGLWDLCSMEASLCWCLPSSAAPPGLHPHPPLALPQHLVPGSGSKGMVVCHTAK